MKISHDRASTPHMDHLSLQIGSLQGPCIGCSGCTGLCNALIDALTLPDIILNKTAKSQ